MASCCFFAESWEKLLTAFSIPSFMWNSKAIFLPISLGSPALQSIGLWSNLPNNKFRPSIDLLHFLISCSFAFHLYLITNLLLNLETSPLLIQSYQEDPMSYCREKIVSPINYKRYYGSFYFMDIIYFFRILTLPDMYVVYVVERF